MTLSDVPEMLVDWRSGELFTDEVYELCLGLFARHEVGEVLSLLPSELQDDFASRLRTEFDNETPAEEYIWFSSGGGDHPSKVSIIDRIRAWLAMDKR